ncbi:MAG: short-chain dehydrogenase [Candidatus Hydrogenedentota bacterium]
MKDLKLYGGWAVVTGASAGLGREFARIIASNGVNCVLIGLGKADLDAVADELRSKHGVEVRALELDLTADGYLEVVAKATEDIPVGILVNNAGIGVGGYFHTRDPKKLTALVKLNCLAPVELTRHFLPAMVDRKTGAVIMVSSIFGLVPAPMEAAYTASKAFDLHFGEALWSEMRGKGVDVVTICPGGMRTGFFVADGLTDPKELARIHRNSNTPEEVAMRTLNALGRKPVTTMPFAWVCGFLARFAPRRLVTMIVRFSFDRMVTYH